jgi:hypothetical protein
MACGQQGRGKAAGWAQPGCVRPPRPGFLGQGEGALQTSRAWLGKRLDTGLAQGRTGPRTAHPAAAGPTPSPADQTGAAQQVSKQGRSRDHQTNILTRPCR